MASSYRTWTWTTPVAPLRFFEASRSAASSPRFRQPFRVRGTDAQPCIAGQQFGEGELRLRVLHPTTEDYARRLSTNAMSCVVEARVGTVSVLLTGISRRARRRS